LISRETNYKRSPHSEAGFAVDRVTGVAAMQEFGEELAGNYCFQAYSLQLSANEEHLLRRMKGTWLAISRRRNELPVLEIPLTGFNRPATCNMMPVLAG
jgi:hypothetical protein